MKTKWLILHASVALVLPALASVSNPAVFVIGQTVVHSNPPGFGAQYDMELRWNNWTDNPRNEPLTIYRYWELTGGGSDATGDYALCNTRYFDTLSSGFLDGGQYRLYREVTNASGAGWIEKVREGTIPTGGFVAAGYEEIGLSAVRAVVPATDAVDNYRVVNGQPYYYAVKARDVDGNWSDFSAPIAGATAHSLSNSDPRILTVQIPNPVIGRNYTNASPLVTMSAIGGTAPLTWSITSGSLPPNLILTAEGRITGMCPASVASTVTIQVQDAASRTHTRQFRIFGSNPAAVAGNPAPPTNVKVAAFNGYLHVWWDASTSSDVTEYKVYRSRFPQSAHRECIYLGSGGPVPQANDLLFVEKETIHVPLPETVSVRVIGLQGDGTAWWRQGSSSATQEIVTIPGPVPAQMQAENCGTGCVRITCAAAAEFGISLFKYAATNDAWWGATMLPTGRTYRIECWVRGEGLPVAHTNIRFRVPQYFDRRVTGIVNGAWVKLSATFTVTNWLTSNMAVSGPNFLFTGPGTVYVDNAVLYDTTAGEQACGYYTPVHRLYAQFTGASNPAHKGVLRYRWLDDPFEHAIRPAVMSRRYWEPNRGARNSQPLHLHQMLQAAYDSGDSPATRVIPWITVNLHWNENDYVKLVEYLAAPSTVGYGAVRAAQRGVATPWADEFRAIYIEMGNEPWNSGYFFVFRGGFSADSGRTYGRWCQYIWDYVASNTVYWTNSIKVLLGGWNGGAGVNQFTGQARLACPHATHVGFTTYLGGWEAGQGGQIGGTTWSDDGLQQWTTYLDHSGKKWANNVTALQTAMAQTGMPFDIVIYEGGPSYLMSGLNGVSLTPAEQEVTRNYGRTLAASIGTLDFWLYAMLRGVKEQSFFSFIEDKGLWASHTYVFQGYRPHPSWQGLGLVNAARAGGHILVTVPERLPFCNLLETNGAVLVTNATMASVYAFKQGNNYAILALNKKIDGVHNGVNFGDGVTPLTLRLPFTNPSKITLYKLSGDPRLTNRQQMNFNVVTQDISLAYFSTNFIVDQFTGGLSGGMPTGAVFMYVFENVTDDPLPAAPQVTINQAATQADPNDGSASPVIYFTVMFDRPVMGFTNGAASITLGGSAMPQTAVITPEAGGGGAVYSVAVSGMQRAGTVRASVPAGAAFSAADGTPCAASTSTDNTVTNLYPSGWVLAEWEFLDDTGGTNFTQATKATYLHSALLPAFVTNGPGCTLTQNRMYNNDAFCVLGCESATLNWDDYIAWTLTPTAGWGVSVSSIRLGGFTGSAASTNLYQLRWSTNGFVSSAELPLAPTNVVYWKSLGTTGGTAMEADARGEPGLSNMAHAVQFRLYIWRAYNNLSPTGIGKLGSTVPDLVVMGEMLPRMPYIIEHPANALVQLGTSVSFSVEADGMAPFFYQWYHNSAPVANATAAVYQIASVQLSHTGMYYVVVSNAYGTAASYTAELSIIPEPVMLTGALLALLGLKRE